MAETSRIPQHIKALNNGDEAARGEAVRALKASESADWEAVPKDVMKPLVEALRQQLLKRADGTGSRLPTHLRRDVVHILGKIGPRAAAAVPTLSDLLKEEEPVGVREATATALGEIGPDAKAATTALLAVLTPECRIPLAIRVASALGDIGGLDSRGRNTLYALWRATASSPATQIQVALALCKLKGDFPGVLSGLATSAAAGPNTAVRLAASEALGWCCKTQPGVVPALTAASHDADDTVQAAAVAGLAKLGVDPDKAVQICAKQLKDCPAAETALRRSGVAAVSVLKKALEDPEPAVREKAANILSSIGEAAADAVAPLTKALRDRSTDVRLSAAKAIWNITKNPDAVVPALAGLLTSKMWPVPPDSEVRRRFLQSVIEALGRIGPPASAAVPALGALSSDESRLVRESAARNLQLIAPVAVAKAAR